MAEDITKQPTSETQTTQQVTEENTTQVQTPTDNQQQDVQNDENSNTEGNIDGEGTQQLGEEPTTEPKPTIEELQSKLNEYQIREEEDKMIRERLGLQNVDQRTYDFMNIDQQIVNEGKQVYLKLCNEYGIDANPNNIDKSVEELKKTDPAKAYEFQRRFEQLGQEVNAKRGEVQLQNAAYEVNKFENDYSGILQASPAIMNIMQEYVHTYGTSGNIYNRLQNVMDIIIPAYQEAFNAGRMFALEDKAKKDTSAVQGGVATANTQTYNPGTIFTREQISKMSSDEFAKYEKEIQRQMIEGKIQ